MASNKRKVSEIDLFEEAGVETVEEYFNMLDKGFKALVEDRKKQEKAVVDAQRTYMKSFLNDYAKRRKELEQLGIKDTEDYRRKLLDDFNKKKTQEDLKKIEEYQKAKYKIETQYDKKRQAEERKAREQENKEKLEFYKQLEEQNVKLNEAQKQDRDRAKIEIQQTSIEKNINSTMKQLTAAVEKLDGSVNKYSQYSAGINARLQGSGSNAERMIWGQNRFGAIESNLTNVVGVNPYFRTETMLDNLQSLVEAGIASNIEQRAFLQTAKDDIATTFDAANGALLRIIRLQQSDSTAARLGMEAYLTRFLNELVENTEYLNSTFDTVQEALLEASSFMETKASTEFEYVVQKWLGALTGVGLSEASASSIAQALGYLGSGNVEALNSSNLQNLLVMAASRGGLNYADLLGGGLSSQSTDTLMRSLVEYMIEIGGSNSNVVKSQFAQTFGLTYSDLKAAQQLSSSLNDIAGNFMSYQGMYDELGYQLNSLPQRIAMASMMDTIWDNLEFGLASNIAKNPALAAIWKVTGLIQSNTGGINIPAVSTLMGGVDLEATVENLVRLGVVGISSLGMIGDLVGGLASTLAPSSILTRLGITSADNTITRGTGLSGRSSGLSTSASAVKRVVGTSSGEDIASGAVTSATDTAKETKTGEEEEENPLDAIKEYLIDTFSGKFATLAENVQALKDKVVDGEVEISNYNQDITKLGVLGGSYLF